MDLSEKLLRLKPEAVHAEEWNVRLELAALYRAFDWLGWTESIYNHITARVPGAERSAIRCRRRRAACTRAGRP